MKRLAIRHGTVRAWLKATQDLHSRDASMLCWIQTRVCRWNLLQGKDRKKNWSQDHHISNEVGFNSRKIGMFHDFPWCSLDIELKGRLWQRNVVISQRRRVTHSNAATSFPKLFRQVHPTCHRRLQSPDPDIHRGDLPIWMAPKICKSSIKSYKIL